MLASLHLLASVSAEADWFFSLFFIAGSHRRVETSLGFAAGAAGVASSVALQSPLHRPENSNPLQRKRFAADSAQGGRASAAVCAGLGKDLD